MTGHAKSRVLTDAPVEAGKLSMALKAVLGLDDFALEVRGG